jgi:mono/diheme cytochrome c family protein
LISSYRAFAASIALTHDVEDHGGVMEAKMEMVKIACAAALLLTTANAETRLERGTYLVKGPVACGNCHTQQTPQGPVEDRELAGGLVLPAEGFQVITPNITQDKETGIGAWTDEQIIAAIREGKRPDGSIIGPPMPITQHRNLSDDDAKAIVAYLRSVKPVSSKIARNTYPFPLPPAWGPPVTSVAAVSIDDPVKYGAYLAGPVAHCIVCHSARDERGVPDPVHNLGTGGVEIKGAWGVSVSANITPTHLKDWTDDQIKTLVKTGIRPDGKHILPPMGIYYYANISDRDLTAIVAYLRTLPPR